MQKKQNNNLLLKVIVIGGLIAALVYAFHPAVGSFSLIVNGKPVADSSAYLAAIPTLFFTLLLMGVVMFIVFLGFSMILFMATLFFSFLGIVLMAPYFWPILAIIFLVILIMSITDSKTRNSRN